MAEEKQGVEIKKEPVAVPEEEIIKAKKKERAPPTKKIVAELKPIEEEEVAAPPVKKIEVELVPEEFLPPEKPYPEHPVTPVPVDRPVVIDVETTGANPWDSRIICISVKDLTLPDSEIKTFYDEDEEKMVRDFIEWYEQNAFNEVIGFLVAFDFRFIFAKCLRYIIPAPNFFNSRLYDIANILKQVKGEFVYNMNKQGSLNDWSKFLFGLEKTMTISEVFDAYKKKQIDKIIEYNRNDVLLETLIYSAIVYVKGGE